MAGLCPTSATQTTQTTAGLSPWSQPYVSSMLGAAQQQVFNTDPTTGQVTGIVPYLAYGAPVAGSEYKAGMGPGEQAAARSAVASPTELQQQAYQSAGQMRTPSAFNLAQMGASEGISGLLNMPSISAAETRAAQLGAAPTAEAQQFSGPGAVGFERVASRDITAPEMEAAQTNYSPQLQQFQMGPAERVAGQQISADMAQAAQMGPAERVSTQSAAGPGSLDAYISPYMQNVVDVQQREAKRQAAIAQQALGAKAAQSGAFGGAGSALQRAQANAQLQRDLQGIQAVGSQSAFQQAQQQFNAEQQARLVAQQANQQAGIQVGAQNLGAQQQIALANQAAKLQASGMTAQQALQAAMANQQAGMNVGAQNLSAQLATQQLGTQTGLQTALANLSSRQQAAVQNQAAKLQAAGMNQQQAMQAALANQQAGMQTGQFNAQQAFNTALQNAQLRQQAGLANQAMQGQFGLQQGQFQQAANLANQQAANQIAQANQQARLAGLQGAISGSAQLGGLGQQQLAAEQSIANLQNTLGQQQQANQQAVINQAMQNFQLQKMYPQQQLQYLSGMLSGLPVSSQGSVSQIPGPNLLSQLGGLGIAGAGAYGLYNKLVPGTKKGGLIKKYAAGGIVDLGMSKALKQ